MNARLAGLAARRALPPAAALVLAVWVAALALREWSPPGLALAAADPERAARGLTRQGVWIGLLAVLTPIVIARTASQVGRWRRGEADWLATGRPSRAGVLLSTLVGSAGVALCALVAGALVVELAAGASGAGVRLVGPIESNPIVLDAEHPRARRELTPPGGGWPQGARLGVHLRAVAPSRSRIALRVAVEGAPATAVDRELGYHGVLEVAVPPGPGRAVLELAIAEPELAEPELRPRGRAAWIVPRGGLELWRSAHSERAASTAVVLRVAPALVAWLALALGLASFTGAAIAAMGAATPWIAVWLSDAAPRWLPAADLPAALGRIGAGVVPPAAGAAPWIGALILCTAGLALGAAGLTTWRRVP